MKVSNLYFNILPNKVSLKPNDSKMTHAQNMTTLGDFPKSYCPNISFGSISCNDIDFEYDFFKVADDIINNHLDKMELTKDLSDSQQIQFRKNLFSCDKPTLLNFMFDAKPSILLSGKYPFFENNDKYDFVSRNLRSPLKNDKVYLSSNLFILNKELSKQVIDENKELYSKRMGMPDTVSTDEIYKKLTGKDSPLKKQKGYDDLIGVTLGYSPKNAVLFQLEQEIPDKYEARKRPIYYANMLDKIFNSEQSPYKDFSNEFKTDIQSSINYVKKNGFSNTNLNAIGYSYIQIAPDYNHTEKLLENANTVYSKAKRLTTL